MTAVYARRTTRSMLGAVLEERARCAFVLLVVVAGVHLPGRFAGVGIRLGGLVSTEVNLEIPRFTVRSALPSLRATLMALGLKDVFDEQHADLTGIAGKKGDLIVSNVIHQAFIEVNEKGTEAAAATAIDVVLTAARYPPPPRPIDFHVDRPFLFLLRDSKSQQLLFVGRVTGPRRRRPRRRAEFRRELREG